MTDAELDDIYDTADLLMKAGKWSIIDDLLQYYGNAAWRMDIDLLMSWATVTNVCRNKLQKRKYFMIRCMEFHSDPKSPDLWKGLWEDDTDPTEDLKKLGFRTL